MSNSETNLSESDDVAARDPDSRPSISTPGSKSVRVPLIIGAIVSLITIVLVFRMRGQAAETDHQAVFFQCLTVGLLGTILAAISFQVAAARVKLPWLVPGLFLMTIVSLIGLFRFESFSGEMIPQFSLRFGNGNAPPPMQTAVRNAAQDSAQMATASAEDSDTNAPTSNVSSNGFLGNSRTGIFSGTFVRPRSAQDVQELWNIGIGGGWGSFAVGNQLAVTLEQRDQQEWVTAYALETGELIWKHAYDAYHFNPLGGLGPRSTPQIDGDAVFTQGATGMVKCLSLETGDVRWEVDLLELADWNQEESESEIAWGRSGSPLLVNGLCVVPFGGPESLPRQTPRSLIALDQQTGEMVWTAGDDQISYASAQVLNVQASSEQVSNQIVIVNEKTISGHAIENGRTLWSTPWEGDSNGGANCASVIPAGENKFLIGKGYGGGSALMEILPKEEGWSVELIWESRRLMKTKFNHAIAVEDVCYGISNGALEAIRLSSAERLWLQSRRDRCGQGQAILADDTLIVQNEAGDVSFVNANPEQYEESIRIPALSSKTWNIPTLAGKYLLVRNDRQAICFVVGDSTSSGSL